MTKSAETQINTALALAQLVQSKDAGRGCRLSADRTKALWHFITLLTTSSAEASADEEKSANGPKTRGPDPFKIDAETAAAVSDAAAGAGDLLAATGE